MVDTFCCAMAHPCKSLLLCMGVFYVMCIYVVPFVPPDNVLSKFMRYARLYICSPAIHHGRQGQKSYRISKNGENATLFAILTDSTKVGKYATSVSGVVWKRLK